MYDKELNERYAKAISQVKTVIKCLNKELKSKIPDELIAIIEREASPSYHWQYDFKKKFWDQDYMPETYSILDDIYLLYLKDKDDEKTDYEKKISLYKKILTNDIDSSKEFSEKESVGLNEKKYKKFLNDNNTSNRSKDSIDSIFSEMLSMDKTSKYFLLLKKIKKKRSTNDKEMGKKYTIDNKNSDNMDKQQKVNMKEKFEGLMDIKCKVNTKNPKTVCYLKKEKFIRLQKGVNCND